MRIAVMTDIYLPQLSGVADSIELLVSELRKLGHTVRIYAPALPGAAADSHVCRLPSWALPGSAGSMVLVFPFGGMSDIRVFSPDVIHTHTFSTAGLLGLYASRRLGVPFVATDHTSPADYLHYVGLDYKFFAWAVRKFASWFHGKCKVVTAPSQHILDELSDYGMRGNHRVVISNAVRTDFFKPLPDKAALKQKYGVKDNAVMFFGRIALEKNLLFGVDVFAEVVKDTPAQLVILGGGPFEQELRAHIKSRGLESHAKFLGVLRGEALVEALNTADINFAPSTSEIQPMAILQSMSCELPMVAARAGGVPEVVIDGDTGYLVEPTDKATYVAKLKELLNDPQLRANMGRAGRGVVMNYAPEALVKKFEAEYERAKTL